MAFMCQTKLFLKFFCLLKFDIDFFIFYDIISGAVFDGVNFRPVGQAAKTPPSQGGIMGSIPVRVTKNRRSKMTADFLFSSFWFLSFTICQE